MCSDCSWLLSGVVCEGMLGGVLRGVECYVGLLGGVLRGVVCCVGLLGGVLRTGDVLYVGDINLDLKLIYTRMFKGLFFK